MIDYITRFKAKEEQDQRARLRKTMVTTLLFVCVTLASAVNGWSFIAGVAFASFFFFIWRFTK